MFPLKLNILSNTRCILRELISTFAPLLFPSRRYKISISKNFEKIVVHSWLSSFLPTDTSFPRESSSPICSFFGRETLYYIILFRREEAKGRKEKEGERKNKGIKKVHHIQRYTQRHMHAASRLLTSNVSARAQEYTRVGGEGGTFCPQTRQGPHRAH